MRSESPTSRSRDHVMTPASVLGLIPIDKTTPLERKVKILELQQKQQQSKTNRSNEYSTPVIEIALDTEERLLLETFQQFVKAWEDGSVKGQSPKKVIVRVAGGWVRDKILGLPSHDVDIALDTCTGVEFATTLKQHLESNMKNEKQGDNLKTNLCGRMGVIAANPAQSKHLETATMKVFGVEVDFSNLRHETYAQDSRIPNTTIGTALEDAYRRDFTMNSLYYNLENECIEDWTWRGLQDLLETKIVHTPLEAYQTFHDDPLRVLRAIRFAVRYQMKLSEDLIHVSRHPQIHEELHRKVSRERVGKELEGMLSGKHADPMQAMDLICALKLAGSIFCLPDDTPIMGSIAQEHLELVPYHATEEEYLAQIRELAWEEARECMKTLRMVFKSFCIHSDGFVSENPSEKPGMAKTPIDNRLIYLAVILLPYMHLQYVVKNKAKSVVEYMIRDGIKFKQKDVVSMGSLTIGLDDMMLLLQRVPDCSPTSRLQAGLLLRSTKEMWVTTLITATVALVRQRHHEEMDWFRRAKDWYDTIVTSMELDECWNTKPLLNGQDLIQTLGLEKGPSVGMYAQEQIQWMLLNPEGSIPELVEHLKGFQQARELDQNQAAPHISKKMHL